MPRQLKSNPSHRRRLKTGRKCPWPWATEPGFMIHTHSLGRAARYYPQQTALVSEAKRLTFREAHDRVENIAAALSRHGFQKGDRLAILLPNEPEYIALVYILDRLKDM